VTLGASPVGKVEPLSIYFPTLDNLIKTATASDAWLRELGYIDLEARTLQPLDNPFGPRLSPMS